MLTISVSVPRWDSGLMSKSIQVYSYQGEDDEQILDVAGGDDTIYKQALLTRLSGLTRVCANGCSINHDCGSKPEELQCLNASICNMWVGHTDGIFQRLTIVRTLWL